MIPLTHDTKAYSPHQAKNRNRGVIHKYRVVAKKKDNSCAPVAAKEGRKNVKGTLGL